MTTEGVKKLIGRIATEDSFKEHFFKDSAAAIKASGYAVDAQEAKALATLKPEDVSFDVERRAMGHGDKAEVEFGVTAIKKFKGRGGPNIVTRPP